MKCNLNKWNVVDKWNVLDNKWNVVENKWNEMLLITNEK